MVDNENYTRIWQTVQVIPSGYVASYGQIADLAGLPGRARLVGKALAKVPKEGWNGLEVPWHRVINSQGKISFPKESEQFKRQKELLQIENVVVLGEKVVLKEFQWSPDLETILYSLSY